MSVWFITGAARGIGLALAREALSRGNDVIASARDIDKLSLLKAEAPDRVFPVEFDVCDQTGIADAAKAGQEWKGRIDVLVNNAGHGIHGAVEEVPDEAWRKVFEVNVFGLLAVTRAVLPGMRARRSGHVVNLSSVAGLVGGSGTGAYSATKFAVEGLSEAMAEEVAALGIRVTIVEPGPFRTDFNGSSLLLAEGSIADYRETAGQRTEKLRAGSGQQEGDPAKAAALICDAVESENPPLHLLIGGAAHERYKQKAGAMAAENTIWHDRAVATGFRKNSNYIL